MALIALFLTLTASHPGRRPAPARRRIVIAFAAIALGLAIFALFFGLVSGCDRPGPTNEQFLFRRP
jgi:hypothetical protein